MYMYVRAYVDVASQVISEMDFLSFTGMVLCCKEWQPGRLPLLQGELSVLARLTGRAELYL